MGAHSLPDDVEPDAGNTEPSELTREFDAGELADILERFQAGHGLHVDGWSVGADADGRIVPNVWGRP